MPTGRSVVERNAAASSRAPPVTEAWQRDNTCWRRGAIREGKNDTSWVGVNFIGPKNKKNHTIIRLVQMDGKDLN
jgi:hypothetical protein